MARQPNDPAQKSDAVDEKAAGSTVSGIAEPAQASPEVAQEVLVANDAPADLAAESDPSLLAHIESAAATATDVRVHAGLSTLITLLHELRVKFAATEHLIADDLRAKIKAIL